VAVVQLGDDVAGEGGLTAHRLDLVFQGAELLPLGRDDEAAQVAEDAVHAPVGETVLDAVRIHDAVAPIVAGLEPPRLLAVVLAQVLRVG
jgi:hypothetical protein